MFLPLQSYPSLLCAFVAPAMHIICVLYRIFCTLLSFTFAQLCKITEMSWRIRKWIRKRRRSSKRGERKNRIEEKKTQRKSDWKYGKLSYSPFKRDHIWAVSTECFCLSFIRRCRCHWCRYGLQQFINPYNHIISFICMFMLIYSSLKKSPSLLFIGYYNYPRSYLYLKFDLPSIGDWVSRVYSLVCCQSTINSHFFALCAFSWEKWLKRRRDADQVLQLWLIFEMSLLNCLLFFTANANDLLYSLCKLIRVRWRE